MKPSIKGVLASAVAVSFFALSGACVTAQAEPELVVNFGQSNNPGEPHAMGGDYWQKIMKEESGGKIELIHYPSDQLGSKSDLIDQMLMGNPVIAPMNATNFADLGLPDFAIMMAPYLTNSWEEVEKLMASDVYKKLEKQLEEKGYKVLANNWHYGVRHTLTKKQVKHPSDLHGMRVRVPNSTSSILIMKSVGASATPLVMNEIYPALQQGTIDGLENPLTTILGGHWQEVAKYIILDGHTYDLNSMVCGMSFWNTLTKEQQDLLVKTAQEAGVYQNEQMEAQSAEARAKLEKDGVIFTEADHDEWVKAAESFYDAPEFKNWTPGLRDEVKAALAK